MSSAWRSGALYCASLIPEVSIVVAAHDSVSVIADCLAALEAQEGGEAAEIILADSSHDGTAELVRDRFPGVHLLHFDEPLTVPELRGRAIATTRGRIVAVLDPFSIAAPGWLRGIRTAHDEHPNLVIGGAVSLHRSAEQGLLAWAVYINEYGMFMPPVEQGEVDIVPGCNVSYKREALFDGERPRHPVFWKTFVNWEVEATGSRLRLAPGAVVSLQKPVPFMDYLRTRYDHGRCFAGMRSKALGLPERLARAATAPLLPLLLLWRWGRVYWPKGRYRGQLLATLPLQLLLFGNWARGELMGYLRGAGDSCASLYY